MALFSAWTTVALAAAVTHGSPATADAPAVSPPHHDPAAQPGYVVQLSPGPDLARRMGTRVTLRPLDKGAANRRSAVALELPRPATTDDPPEPQRVELPAGVWRIEVGAPGFLPSTREFSVDATRPEQTLAWDLLPDTLSADVTVPVAAAGQPAIAVTATSTDGRKKWSCVARQTPCTLRLGRGGWTLEAHARGFRPVRGPVQVANDRPLTVPLTMTPGDDGMAFTTGTKEHVVKDIRKRAVIGLGVAAIPAFAAGLGLTIAGRNNYVRAVYAAPCDSPYGPVCANSLIRPIHTTGAGVGSLGASAGLLVTSVTGAFDVPKRTWWILLGLGGGLTVVGAAWVGGNTHFLDRDLRSGPLTDIDGRVGRRLVASTVLGLGLGAAAGALTHALVLRRQQRAALAPYAGFGQAGLVLTGRF